MGMMPPIPPQRDVAGTAELTGAQKALYETLVSQSDRLGRIYIGAILVLKQHTNPDRLALAAHNFRELLEKLPLYFEKLPVSREGGFPDSLKPPDLLPEVRKLNDAWRKLKAPKSQTLPDATGREQDVRSYLRASETFFGRFEKAYPTRKAKATLVLRKLDPTRLPLPPAIEDLHVEEFERHRQYFVAVCHHRQEVTSKEFEDWQSSCERFLLDRLIPRTFEDQAAIDKIIQEGERDASS
jgi:hypothetical protein